MYMLMRHWMVRCNRWVKDTYPFRWHPPRYVRRRDEDGGRQSQRYKPPPKNLTARLLPIDLEYHLPTVSPQQMPSGRHKTTYASKRGIITQ